MARLDEIKKERLKKIEELRKLGINPYPYSYAKKNNCEEIIKKFSKIKAGEETKINVNLAGRIINLRQLGKIAFANLQDDSGRLQIVLREDILKNKFDFFKKYIDTGDFLGIEGRVIKTKTGELSVLANKFEILSKAILPLPEKWHGLKNLEERYRMRYVDLIVNRETKKIFVTRTKIINAIREFLNSEGFIEVETPSLQLVYGGAEARPFITELHDLHMKVYLSISPELYLKRLLVGDFEKVYTICKNFRNEGIDRTHNPEFTMLECYQAYADYNDMTKLYEEIWSYVLDKLEKGKEIEYQGQKINFKRWQRVTMYEGLKKYAQIDVKKTSTKELLEKAKALVLDVDEKTPRGLIIAELAKKLVEPKLIQPTHFVDHPKETTPLCKLKRDDPELIERNEPFIAGMEVGNIYSELNDPELQRKYFEEQAEFLKKKGLAHPYDKDFLNALSYGMPPAGGLGLGIDRMVMILTNQHSIQDVILFPFMKLQEEQRR